MNVLIIPSWYPSAAFPSTGIFFQEQAALLAAHRQDVNVGISLWGSHEPDLWLRACRPLDVLMRGLSKPALRQADRMLDGNIVEFFTPAYTWTRRIREGNIKGIIAANHENFRRYEAYFGKVDLIHAHVAYPAGAVAQALAEKFRIPYLITEHMSPFPMGSFSRDYQRTVIPPLQKADRVLVLSAAQQERLSQFGIVAEINSNFIDDAFFVPGDSSEKDAFRVLATGRLEQQKNYPLMLAIMKELADRPVVLKVIGDGQESRSLQKLTDQYGLTEQVAWLGECGREEVRAALRETNLLINTSCHENQPVAILEALACGVPVISRAWKGAAELLDGAFGHVVASDDPAEYADLIRKLMVSGISHRSEIRRAFDRRFGTRLLVDRLINSYSSVLS